MRQYLVIQGTARVETGGAPELLQDLARVYIGPDARFPPVADPPAGSIVRITVDKITGVGPWTCVAVGSGPSSASTMCVPAGRADRRSLPRRARPTAPRPPSSL